jgi:uncharacterized membrane protein (DUF2068 family)
VAVKTLRKPAAKQGASLLVLIGAYKLFECALLIAAGIGALRLLHKDLQVVLMHWVHILRVDPDNRYIHGLLSKAFAVSPKQLRELSVGTFLYAGLRFAEGIGLVMRKRWGEYLTVIATAVFIPLEVYEIFHRFHWLKVALLVVNIAIVIYLYQAIRRKIGKL